MAVATPIEVEIQAQRRAARPDFALWRLGLRPFYLVASVFAALSIGLWVAQYAGWLETPYVSGPMGHAHEMIFGFVLVGFAGIMRVLVPWLFSAWYRDAVVASACLRSTAYVIFAIRYWPILTRPRIDGRPG